MVASLKIPQAHSICLFYFYTHTNTTISKVSIMSTEIPRLSNYDRFLNSVATKRSYNPLRTIWDIQQRAGPKMVSLGSGAPNPLCFPFESITIRTKTGHIFDVEGQELDTALSYTGSRGFNPLIEWLTSFQKRIQDPPYARENPNLNELIVVPGSQDGQCKVLEMIVEAGDPVIITQPTYPAILAAIRALGAKMVALEMDEDGPRPDCLERILQEYTASNERRPKILVIQPNHINPTGVCTKLDRMKEIYRLVCQYDMLIIEDDPYYYLAFTPDHIPPPTFLSLDTQGRVLRAESFSKVVSSGLRLGTLSGPRPLVERVVMHIDCSTLQASTLSQAILLRLLTQYGQDGYLEHLRKVAAFYQDRSRMMLRAAKRYLTDLAEWTEPSGGMFMWLKIHGVRDTRKMMEEKGVDKMVMLASGCYFMLDDSKPTQYLRASFSWASEEEMNEGFRRLADMIKEEISSQRV